MQKTKFQIGISPFSEAIQDLKRKMDVDYPVIVLEKEESRTLNLRKLSDGIERMKEILDLQDVKAGVFHKDESKEILFKAARPPDKSNAPFRLQREWEDEMIQDYPKLLTQIKTGIMKHFGLAKADPVFSIRGKLFISPGTHRPLTVREWRTIESSITGFLSANKDDLRFRMFNQASVIGSILDRLHEQGVDPDKVSYEDVRRDVEGAPKKMEDLLRYTEIKDRHKLFLDYQSEHTAENITKLNDDVRSQVKLTINNTFASGNGRKLEQKLEENFADLNRDWRRIAYTEAGHNTVSTGLYRILSTAKPGERIYVRAIGPRDDDRISWHCKNKVAGKIFILLPTAPDNPDMEEVEDPIYGTVHVIWAGKNYMINKGVPEKQWRVVYGLQHPFCRHNFVRTSERKERIIRAGLGIA